MKQGRLLKADNKSCIIPKVSRTTNFLERMRGLLFRPPLDIDEALLIEPCSSVHTIGMGYPIDLIFISKDWKIIKTVSELKPWRSASCLSAHKVVEMPGGKLSGLELSEEQQIEWQDETTK